MFIECSAPDIATEAQSVLLWRLQVAWPCHWHVGDRCITVFSIAHYELETRRRWMQRRR